MARRERRGAASFTTSKQQARRLVASGLRLGAQGGDAVGVELGDAAGAWGRLTTGPPSLSTRRCWDTAGRLTGNCWAGSPTEHGR
jgi:hypothetical protein